MKNVMIIGLMSFFLAGTLPMIQAQEKPRKENCKKKDNKNCQQEQKKEGDKQKSCCKNH